MSGRYYLGVDVGTTGTKTLLTNADGKILHTAYREYPIATAPGGISEQNALDWLDAVATTVGEIAEMSGREIVKKIEAVSVSAQGATMVPVDGDYNPLCPAITWMDNRAAAEAEEMAAALEGEADARHRTGWNLSGGLDAPKILWLKRHKPDIFNSARSFVSTLEFVNRFLCGNGAGDPSTAAIRALYNINARSYDRRLTELSGIGEERLPPVLPSGAYLGTLTGNAAALTGLEESVKVFNGAHDQYCASIGCGASEYGDTMLSTGTAWVLLAITDRLIFSSPGLMPGLFPVEGAGDTKRCGAMASLGGVGNALRWLRDILGEDYRSLDRGAAGRREKNAGLYVLPYHNGAGFPENNGDMRGCVCGLGAETDKYDLAYTVMEGVAFETRRALDIIGRENISAGRLYLTGGASRSAVWRSIIADATRRELICNNEIEACAYGAARLAALGCGVRLLESLPGAFSVVPDSASLDYYEEKYRRYLTLANALTGFSNLFAARRSDLQ